LNATSFRELDKFCTTPYDDQTVFVLQVKWFWGLEPATFRERSLSVAISSNRVANWITSNGKRVNQYLSRLEPSVRPPYAHAFSGGWTFSPI
jgi:hypothetical protein